MTSIANTTTIIPATATEGTRVVARIPLRLQSVANLREHFGARASRTSKERRTVELVLRQPCVEAGLCGPHDPFTKGKRWPKNGGHLRVKGVRVTFTRIAPGTLDRGNLAGAMKAAEDGVADALGCDDGDPKFDAVYTQEKAGRGVYGLRIEISEVV